MGQFRPVGILTNCAQKTKQLLNGSKVADQVIQHVKVIILAATHD